MIQLAHREPVEEGLQTQNSFTLEAVYYLFWSKEMPSRLNVLSQMLTALLSNHPASTPISRQLYAECFTNILARNMASVSGMDARIDGEDVVFSIQVQGNAVYAIYDSLKNELQSFFLTCDYACRPQTETSPELGLVHYRLRKAAWSVPSGGTLHRMLSFGCDPLQPAWF